MPLILPGDFAEHFDQYVEKLGVLLGLLAESHRESSRYLVGWLVVFNVPSTARTFRDGTLIYCPLRRT